jgi:Flp pilus assembly protein CpaB
LLILVVVFLVGALGYRQYTRHAGGVSVVVSVNSLAQNETISLSDLETIEVPRDRLPRGAFQTPGQVVGRTPSRAVEPRTILTGADFAPSVPDLAQLIPEGRVLYSLNVPNKTLPPSGLTGGDSLDVLVSGISGAGKHRTANVLVRDARLVAYTRNHPPARQEEAPKKTLLGVKVDPPSQAKPKDSGAVLMLAVEPEDVIPLAEVDGSGLHLSIVLHGERGYREKRASVAGRNRVEVIQGRQASLVVVP